MTIEPSSFWRDPPGSTVPEESKRREFVDSRGPRFGAAITTVVLACVLITVGVSHLVAGWILFAQTLIFAVGALAGLRYAPYGLIFRHLVRPRLGPPSKTEPEAPPRFSQGVGMVFAGIGAIGFAAGLPLLGIVFAAFALAAAFLNAAFDYCLGCQMYLLIQRIRPAH
ncbi:MAG TPA: DUF4395 domain-containing protein [Trebonia sp.]|nr:DUF4395 domain-containing protein [Trebonia sp.]